MKQKSLILLLVFLSWVFFGCKTKGPSGDNNHSKVIPSAVLENSPPVPIDADGVGKRAGNKWLPGKENLEAVAPRVDDFLKKLNGRLRLLHCTYDGARLAYLKSFSSNGLKTNEQEWQSRIDIQQVVDDPAAIDLDIQFKLEKGEDNAAGIAVAFDFTDWSTINYVMLPASVYNGNRCKLVDRGYNAGLDRKYLYKKNIPLMSVPIPQLSPERGAVSRLEVNTCNMATPAMCFFSKEKKLGFILLTEQKTPFADNGFIVEESKDRKRASFVISAPGVREKKPLFVGFTESPDRGVDFKAGDQISLRIRLYAFEAANIPAVLEKFMEVRKAITGSNQPRDLIPFSQVASWMTERIDSRWHTGDEFQFYCPENADWISFGWIGGLMNTFPMLALGDGKHLDRVTRTFDFAIPLAQGDAGFFYGAINHDGKPFGRESYNEFPEIVLTRKNADVLYWMVKQFMLLKAQGKADKINPEWEKHIQRLADAFITTWKKNGQWGRMLNNKTGEVAEYNTSGGVMAIAGLALASAYYQDREYFRIAEEAADFYYQRDFVEQGMTTGGCADILQNADSETAAGLMTALMALYEISGNQRWLENSRDLAHLCATWTTSYDYELPEETELGRLGAKLAGIYWASTQNKHGAPGICTSSGDPLFKIYRATGNKRYADLMNDIIHAHGESIRPGGYTNERLTYCDAEHRGERGQHVTGWNELNGFLMALEIPGVYLQTDNDRFYVFDHVKAEILNRDGEVVTLSISNETKFDATVTIFAETSEEAQKPLGYTAFLNWPRVEIKKDDSLQISIAPDGSIIFLNK